MLPWERKEVLVTNEAERFGLAQRALHNAGLKFETRMVNGGNGRRRTGTLGSFEENTGLELFYYIYVKKEDSEQAEYIIKQERSPI